MNQIELFKALKHSGHYFYSNSDKSIVWVFDALSMHHGGTAKARYQMLPSGKYVRTPLKEERQWMK